MGAFQVRPPTGPLLAPRPARGLQRMRKGTGQTAGGGTAAASGPHHLPQEGPAPSAQAPAPGSPWGPWGSPWGPGAGKVREGPGTDARGRPRACRGPHLWGALGLRVLWPQSLRHETLQEPPVLRWSAGSRGPGPWGAGAQGLRPLGWDHDDIRGRARVCPAPRPAVMGTAPPPSPPSRPTAPGQAGCSSPNPQGWRAGLGDADNLSRVGGGDGERPSPPLPPPPALAAPRGPRHRSQDSRLSSCPHVLFLGAAFPSSQSRPLSTRLRVRAARLRAGWASPKDPSGSAAGAGASVC